MGTKKLTRVLVAVDLQDTRQAAFERALPLARSHGAELYLLHAVPAARPYSWYAAERLERMTALLDRAMTAGVAVQTAEQHGDPAGIIRLHAEARNADLIVIGTHARRGWQRLREGSVAERVIRQTSRPTLVVPLEERVADAMLRHILVAVDLSVSPMAAVEQAIALGGHDLERLTILHVVDLGEEATVRWGARLMAEYRSDARRRLKSMVAHIQTAADVRVRVATGRPHLAIQQQAVELNPDVVVVGASARFMHLGSVTARIIRGLRQPLFVVQSQDFLRRQLPAKHELAA